MEGDSGGEGSIGTVRRRSRRGEKEEPGRRISCRAPSSTERSGSDGCPLHGVGASTHAPLSRATDYHQWITSFRVNTRPSADMAPAAGGTGSRPVASHRIGWNRIGHGSVRRCSLRRSTSMSTPVLRFYHLAQMGESSAQQCGRIALNCVNWRAIRSIRSRS